jgi:LuxR family maltose regulon positive regulatory protein
MKPLPTHEPLDDAAADAPEAARPRRKRAAGPRGARAARGTRARLELADPPAAPADDDDELGALAPAAPPLGNPPSYSGFIARPRLLQRIAEGTEASVVLLAAPPGYGKTSLLLEWASAGAQRFAWVALEPRHDDPRALLESLVLALRALEPQTEPQAQPRADRAAAAAGASTLPRLLDTIAALPAGTVLVLDDVQLLRSPESLAVLSRAAQSMPAQTRLALASRTAPAIGLGRLRAHHAVLDIGVRDLALDAEESRRVLLATCPALGEAELERLVRRAEGWPAGLYLAARALQARRPASASLPPGEDHALADYVSEELLAQLPADSLSFLARSSILAELSPPVCDVVLEVGDSGARLRALAEGNLLLAPLDSAHSRYRCHPLLREVLRAELERSEPALIPELHRRAARWFGAEGAIAQAVAHAAAAGEESYAGELLWAQVPACVMQGRVDELRSWLGIFTEEQIASSGPLALSVAHLHLVSGELRLAEHWAEIAEGHQQQLPTGGEDPLTPATALLRAAVGRRGVERMGADARRAYELDRAGGPLRAVACLLLGVSQHLCGDAEAAAATLTEGARLCAVAAPPVQALCLAQLALLAGEAGRWEDAVDLAGRATAALERQGLLDRPAAALVLGVAAWISARQGRADRAKSQLRRSRRCLSGLEDFVPWYDVETRVMQARAAIRLADVGLARALLSEASRLARRTPEVAIFRSWFDAAWGELDELGAAALSGPASLTMAELRILRFLPTHFSFREIGGRLNVSTNTVKSQAHAVYRKLDAESRSEAVEHAATLGLIDPVVI